MRRGRVQRERDRAACGRRAAARSRHDDDAAEVGARDDAERVPRRPVVGGRGGGARVGPEVPREETREALQLGVLGGRPRGRDGDERDVLRREAQPRRRGARRACGRCRRGRRARAFRTPRSRSRLGPRRRASARFRSRRSCRGRPCFLLKGGDGLRRSRPRRGLRGAPRTRFAPGERPRALPKPPF